MSLRRGLVASLALLLGALAPPARAANDTSDFRLHASAAAAHALGGHQARELGWGVAGLAAVEWALLPELGFELELGGLWLSEGDTPNDPRIEPQGAASALHLAMGARWRAIPEGSEGTPWVSVAGGAARTGELTRPVIHAALGFDISIEGGQLAAGPMMGLMHVFQPDNTLRPADANVLLLGVHAMFDPLAARPTDRDGDHIPDSSDQCPAVGEDIDGFEDTDGCPDWDRDPSPPLDTRDECPGAPEDVDEFEDEDGCPDADNDRDGLLDAVDRCPLEPETSNGYADGDGCPDAPSVRVVDDRIVLDERIHFATNSARISAVSHDLLARLAKLISENPTYARIEIQGHADQRGPDWFNERLSRERAQNVLNFLVQRGISRSRLSATGLGSAQPRILRTDERAWFLNRRVEFKVTRQKRLKP